MELKNLIIIGDSIARGYVTPDGTVACWGSILSRKLAQDLQTNIGLCNLSVGGITTPDILKSSLLLSQNVHDPIIIVLSFGVNDIRRIGQEENLPPCEISTKDRLETWEKIIDILQKKFSAPIFITGILPFNEAIYPLHLGQDYKLYRLNKDAELYNQNLKDFAAKKNITFMNWATKIDIHTWPNYLIDELHPNAEGHKILSDIAYEWVRQII